MSNEENQSRTSKSPEQPTRENDSVFQDSITSSSPPHGQTPQQIQFQFINHNDIYQQSPIYQHTTTDSHHSQQTNEMGDFDQQQTFHRHTLDNSRFSDPYIGQGSQRILQNDSTSLFPITIPDNLSIHQDVRPNNPQPHVDLLLNPNLSDPIPGSALNWISTDFLKDTEDALPLDPDLLNQSIQQWWPESFDTSITWLSPMDSLDQVPLFNNCRQNLLDAAPPPVESPGRHSSVSQDGSLFSGSNDDSVLSGEYYVNGEGSRCPKYSRKRKECWNITENIIPLLQPQEILKEKSIFEFPTTHYIQTDDPNLNATLDKQVSLAIYEKMLSSFERICRLESVIFTPFAAGHFPTSELLTYFLRHYLDGFQPVYPIFHVPTFDPNEMHWILVLAVSAIGCNFVNSAEAAQYAQPLHEFVRRAIMVERQKNALNYTPLWLMQAMLLNCIGLIHSGNPQSRDSGLSLFSELVRLAHGEDLFSTSHQSHVQDTRQWGYWIENEMKRRTGYLVWLVDTTFAYTTDSPPLLSLKDAQTPLPVHERLWEANSEYVWQSLYQEENASLYSALETLFIEKRLTPGIGEFSHTLLLHALYQRLWEVGDYFQRPLSWWTPTAERRTRESALPSKSIWLPAIPLFSKWRNSACDCLDTLHWSANGTIAKAAGLEHPTVLHLHTARLVLLVPFREIRTLAMSLARLEVSWDKLDQTPEWRHIWQWGKHDQYKARLSIIHAGSVIWYIRRYSTNAFHEPIAVFLATLTLWAYGLCHHQSQDQQPELSSPISQHTTLASAASPSFIHVDRPCDDEIVQLFVRVGQTMRGNVTGVGDICGPHGPSRILQEGIHILSGLVSAWGIAREYIDILSRMGNQAALTTPATIDARSGEW
jgi:hypothetical protein